MTYTGCIFSDNEYAIMMEIAKNQHITQRKLSKKLGISVSTVNVLINKMIKDGLVKMTQVSQKQVLYMLTPAGMMEKAQKTVNYLKAHYNALCETKEKIKEILEELNQKHDVIYILMHDDEMSAIMSIAVSEFKATHDHAKIMLVDSIKMIKTYHSPVLIHMSVDEDVIKDYVGMAGLEVVSLVERI